MPMSKDDLSQLRSGDMVCNDGSGNSFIVISNVDGKITAIRTLVVSNPTEWTRVGVCDSMLLERILDDMRSVGQ